VGKRFLTGACVCYKGKKYDREKDGTVLSLRDISSCSSFLKKLLPNKTRGNTISTEIDIINVDI
jgi:hypothetical protein